MSSSAGRRVAGFASDAGWASRVGAGGGLACLELGALSLIAARRSRGRCDGAGRMDGGVAGSCGITSAHVGWCGAGSRVLASMVHVSVAPGDGGFKPIGPPLLFEVFPTQEHIDLGLIGL